MQNGNRKIEWKFFAWHKITGQNIIFVFFFINFQIEQCKPLTEDRKNATNKLTLLKLRQKGEWYNFYFISLI